MKFLLTPMGITVVAALSGILMAYSLSQRFEDPWAFYVGTPFAVMVAFGSSYDTWVKPVKRWWRRWRGR